MPCFLSQYAALAPGFIGGRAECVKGGILKNGTQFWGYGEWG